ncbi:hypothetical protein [Bradyrhizobium sp.]|uniref:hypothetical protein n=1 Tax=Bradyrhizobium sp. TaxID=376 RepID=UPI0035A1A739
MEKMLMLNRRAIMTLVVSTSLLATAGLAVAKNAHHNNGHNLLGEKIHKNGKHEIGKIGNNAVVAEVSNDKVVGMSAGNLPAQKVKSSKKMAGADTTQVAANGPIKLAQVGDYYAYCFDTGIDVECYWYPATDVIVTDPWSPYPY